MPTSFIRTAILPLTVVETGERVRVLVELVEQRGDEWLCRFRTGTQHWISAENLEFPQDA